MDGEHIDIIDCCVRSVERAVEDGHLFPGIQEGESFHIPEFKLVLEFLLHDQFVDAGTVGVVHHVIRGSGMGMKHSSSVSSICLHELVEQDI